MGKCGCEAECEDDKNNNGICNEECLTPNCRYDFSFGTLTEPDRDFEMGEKGKEDCTLDEVKIAIAY